MLIDGITFVYLRAFRERVQRRRRRNEEERRAKGCFYAHFPEIYWKPLTAVYQPPLLDDAAGSAAVSPSSASSSRSVSRSRSLVNV